MSSKRPQAHDIDISRPTAAPKAGWGATIVIWGLVVAAFLLIYFFEFDFVWGLAIIVGTALLAVAGWIGWGVVVQRGYFTWMRLAQSPAKLYAAGDATGAEAAFQRALVRAKQFPADDHRRGMMLEVLAEYAGAQARISQARELFDECIDILRLHMGANPMDYFISLNNYAVLLLHLKDYVASQRILERLLDLSLANKEHADGQVIAITPEQLQTIDFILYVNLVCIFLEIGDTDDMRYHLKQSELAFKNLGGGDQKRFNDHFLALRSRCAFERKKMDVAWRLLEEATDSTHVNVMRMRSKLLLGEGKPADAEELIHRFYEAQDKIGPRHHPQYLDVQLHLAECVYQQDRHNEALEVLAEAHKLIADFELPLNARWRDRLRPWLERAQHHRKVDLAASLEKCIGAASKAVDDAIMIIDRFRVRPKVEE
jgi:tetratricopeptide (TPR) repeat protein